MGDKSVETLGSRIEFLSILVTFSPFPPKQCWVFYLFDCTDHSAYTTLNWGAGGIRELTLEANKIEQMLKYRKASFPKSVSTTFVAHCSISKDDNANGKIDRNWLLIVNPFIVFWYRWLISTDFYSSSNSFASAIDLNTSHDWISSSSNWAISKWYSPIFKTVILFFTWFSKAIFMFFTTRDCKIA